MITVFCTKVGDTGEFTAFDVNILHLMCKKHLTIPHKFVCTTDNPEGILPEIEVHQPARKCWGWWNLMEAYSNPSWAEGGPIVYFGLDTLITNNIDGVVRGDTLTLSRDLGYLLENHPVYRSKTTLCHTYSDGVAYIPAGGLPELWTLFLADIPPNSCDFMHVWLTRQLKQGGYQVDLWQDVYPDLLCSWKWPYVKTKRPNEPVVCFHGDPRPRKAAGITPWIKGVWEEAQA